MTGMTKVVLLFAERLRERLSVRRSEGSVCVSVFGVCSPLFHLQSWGEATTDDLLYWKQEKGGGGSFTRT